MSVTNDVGLRVEGVSKHFGGVRALSDVSATFRRGEVHALLGENGAGKSTLVRIIAGVSKPDAGAVSFGNDGSPNGSVALVFQELSLLPELSVTDNLLLGLKDRGTFVGRGNRMALIAETLTRTGLESLDLEAPVSALSLAQRQLLEIARGLLRDPDILILDEPTATLSDVEINRIHQVLDGLRKQGHAIVYITHRLGEVFRLADAITIMRNGYVVSTGATAEFSMDRIYTDMLGEDHRVERRQLATDVDAEPTTHGRTVLSLSHVESRMRFADVDLQVAAGEVVALLGQVGSGADALAKAVAGLVPIHAGTIELDGTPLRRLSRVSGQRRGIAYVSADRVIEGVFLDGTVAMNVSSGSLSRIMNRAGLLSAAKEKALAKQYSDSVSFDADRITAPVVTLSGGNQQKVSIARALAARPRLLVLVEPTRGVDVGARSEIYRSLRDLTAQGLAILVYTSDSAEVLELADRVITMFRGRTVSSRVTRDATEGALLAEILHGGVA